MAERETANGEQDLLVGDVGGTHARFAVVRAATKTSWAISELLDLESSFDDLTGALRVYAERVDRRQLPAIAAIAVAGPVLAGHVRFTNRSWETSETELQRFGFRRALLINDFAALAFAVDVLPPECVHSVGPELVGAEHEPISVLGAGTGFGVACLARAPHGAVALATEGGHMSFAPTTELEIELLRVLARRFGRVSVERILSGPGLESLYGAVEELGGRKSTNLSAAEISARALAGEEFCHATLAHFCAILGSVAGDIALAHGARGGVYLAGGVALKIEPFLRASDFRERFENKGRLAPFTRAIPTKLIEDPYATLRGAARAARERWKTD